MCLTWVIVIVLAALLDPPAGLRRYVLFAHVVFLAVGFGAVLAVALHGLAYLLHWVPIAQVAVLAVALDPMIWLGLAGMCASGILLDPELGRPLTLVKLSLVLFVALHGLWARDLIRELRRLPADAGARLPRPLLRKMGSFSTLAQTGWWGAVVIGFLTTNS